MTNQHNPEQLEILQVPEVARRFEEIDGGIERLQLKVDIIVADEMKAQAQSAKSAQERAHERWAMSPQVLTGQSPDSDQLSKIRQRVDEGYDDQKAA